MITSIKKFQSISLSETKQVSLLNRLDSKYLMSAETLPTFLEMLQEDYVVVEIGNSRSLPYHTIYFDTPDLKLYRLHHNGKLNRLKFRSRKYIEGGQVFNEIKFKANSGRTYKSRIEREELSDQFDNTFRTFAENKYNSLPSELIPQLTVHYNRITLVAKDFSERLTIDTDLTCSYNNATKIFENLVIVELKRDKGDKLSKGERTLRNLRCKESGFSKYCIGVAATHDSVKMNNFKERIRMVEKLCRSERSAL